MTELTLSDTAQLLMFKRGVNDKFDVTTEPLSMEAVKSTTIGICMKASSNSS